jgi:dipeptidyl aminopeptidase/acylaminoacyl peptidase
MNSERRLVCLALAGALASTSSEARPLVSADYFKLQSVGSVQLSPDGSTIAYSVVRNDGDGRPYRQLWLASVAANGDARHVRVGGDSDRGDSPAWSPDSRLIAFMGRIGSSEGLHVARADGSGVRFLAPVVGTNSALTYEGNAIAWSPDAKQIAFVSTTPGPETELASGDPVVITRYKYKPDYAEGMTRFNDNRRRHIFLADLENGAVRQLTPDGGYEEHSIDWSPRGDEILFVSNREPDPDLFYNPDVFSVRATDGTMRRLTATESAEFKPRWSPDGELVVFMGTRRGLTDLETDMEDTHVFVMDVEGGNRRELGSGDDNRQGSPVWSPDGRFVYFNVEERGHERLYRLPAGGGPAELVIGEPGRVTEWSVGPDGRIAYAFMSLSDMAQLYLASGGQTRRLTDLNSEALAGVEIAPVKAFTFVSNDFRFDVEAFLTMPLGRTPSSKHPLILMIHGGPHGQQGPSFNFRSQFYAARGWATLQVNYRGSTGYGQKFTDAVFGDQNGNEAHDVLYGVSAALRRNPWIDRDRLGIEGGSYGGQLTCWIITQTHIFKAAIPLAPIVNNLSYNYMTYYNMYEQMEWGQLPHQGNLMDVLWERSALKHVAKVKTPTMLIHGENDNDVPIAESEQFYVALKDVGVETVFVRYPREGHGLAEPKHQVDLMERSVLWYEKHFGTVE